jgi:hypothetical protein
MCVYGAFLFSFGTIILTEVIIMLENKEIWKDCKGYEGKYQVSSMGRVWSIKRQSVLKGSADKDGYIRVQLTAKNGKTKTEKVHRLVAIAFLDNPDNLPQVNHKDENKQNNCITNLEWCDCSYNIIYSKGKAVVCLELDKVYSCSQ